MKKQSTTDHLAERNKRRERMGLQALGAKPAAITKAADAFTLSLHAFARSKSGGAR